ncbi:MAG: alcohol dehydrogenase catalytic domain-containing protein [Lachnospiraceae bacterium]|nr:alcohol dehydrogenase catalytic domain-containing protein [Lachnospiraceae bacterium]
MMELPKTMKALVAYGKGDYRLETEFPVPECGDDDIIIKTEACGICAGDLKCMHGAERFWGNEKDPSWVQPPFIPGHEFLGYIVKLGKNVKGYQIGERITADQIVPCGECKFCKSGRYWMCEPHATFGFQKNNNGGMAEYVKYSKTAVLHRVPEDMPVIDALLIEPYSCSKHCIDRAQIHNDDVVVISGAGTLGLGMITYAKMQNPEKLIVLDMQDGRLKKAKEFGADMIFNPGKCDVVKEIKNITEGYGCDIYVEATGHPSSVKQGLDMIRKLGRFVEFSVFGSETTVDWSVIGDGKELDLLGSHLSPYCFPFVIEHIYKGDLKTDGVVSSIYGLDEWKEAFEKATGMDGDLKVAFKF